MVLNFQGFARCATGIACTSLNNKKGRQKYKTYVTLYITNTSQTFNFSRTNKVSRKGIFIKVTNTGYSQIQHSAVLASYAPHICIET